MEYQSLDTEIMEYQSLDTEIMEYQSLDTEIMEYQSLDTETSKPNLNPIILEQTLNPKPEKEIIRNEMFQSLSRECKFVLYLIFHAPIEIAELFMSEYEGKAASLTKMRYVLNGLFKWRWNTIQATFSELKTFVGEYYR